MSRVTHELTEENEMPDLAVVLDQFNGGTPMTGRARESDPGLRRKVVRALAGEARGVSPLDVVNRVAKTDQERKAVKSEVRDLLNRGEVTIGSDLRLYRK
jgi:hypothetical protein